jgi:hypothetical protein
VSFPRDNTFNEHQKELPPTGLRPGGPPTAPGTEMPTDEAEPPASEGGLDPDAADEDERSG